MVDAPPVEAFRVRQLISVQSSYDDGAKDTGYATSIARSAPIYHYVGPAETVAAAACHEPRLPMPHPAFWWQMRNPDGTSELVLFLAEEPGSDEQIITASGWLVRDPKRITDANHVDITIVPAQHRVWDTFSKLGTEGAMRLAKLAVGAICLAMRVRANASSRLSIARRIGITRNAEHGWEYRVVDLPAAQAARVDLGGTHASPRWHVRRGHMRRLADGREVPVRECEVGDKARGGVVKDYEVAPMDGEDA